MKKIIVHADQLAPSETTDMDLHGFQKMYRSLNGNAHSVLIWSNTVYGVEML